MKGGVHRLEVNGLVRPARKLASLNVQAQRAGLCHIRCIIAAREGPSGAGCWREGAKACSPSLRRCPTLLLLRRRQARMRDVFLLPLLRVGSWLGGALTCRCCWLHQHAGHRCAGGAVAWTVGRVVQAAVAAAAVACGRMRIIHGAAIKRLVQASTVGRRWLLRGCGRSLLRLLLCCGHRRRRGVRAWARDEFCEGRGAGAGVEQAPQHSTAKPPCAARAAVRSLQADFKGYVQRAQDRPGERTGSRRRTFRSQPPSSVTRWCQRPREEQSMQLMRSGTGTSGARIACRRHFASRSS